MTAMAILLIWSCILELTLYLLPWRYRRILAGLALFIIPFSALAIALTVVNVWSIATLIISCYRIFNLIRAACGMSNESYLKKVCTDSSLYLVGSQLIAFGLLAYVPDIPAKALLAVLSWTSLAVAVLLFATFVRTMYKTRPVREHAAFSDRELPSITVAIPARNETDDLQDCLAHLVDTTYPKLEILVLDDHSQTRRTPEIIRSFAQDGVRFLAADEIGHDWLGKNQAYARLAREANGDYIVFCGVDVVFDRHSLRELLSTMLAKQKTMMTVLPERSPLLHPSYSLIQAMRYWWELVPPRRLFNRPPVLSSCWIINRQFLEHVGGFNAVKQSITPEAYFAKRALEHDGYSFVRSTYRMGITSVKSHKAQRQTAIRLRYPQLHRRIELAAGLSTAEITLLFVPYGIALAGLATSIPLVTWLPAVLSSVLLTTTYQIMATRIRIHNSWFGLLAFPAVVVTDILLIHYSMWRYEFSTVVWSGRDVRIPIMRVYESLPRI